MANLSLGKITATAGAPVRITTNQTSASASLPVHSYLIEALSTNTGKVYIGNSTLNRTTLAGVYAILPPATTSVYPSFSSAVSYAPSIFNAADIWIDVDTSTEGVLASVVQT